MSHRVLIVGIGRPSLGDDALGLVAAARLRERLAGAAAVIADAGTGWDALHALGEAHRCVIIDAAQAEASRFPPGRWCRLRYPDQAAALANVPLRNTHSMGTAGLLAMAATLGWLPEETWVYALAGERFEPETGLSPAVAAALDTFVSEIAGHVHAWIRQPGRGGDR